MMETSQFLLKVVVRFYGIPAGLSVDLFLIGFVLVFRIGVPFQFSAKDDSILPKKVLSFKDNL